MGLTAPLFTVFRMGISWRDIILIGGGLFLIAKATYEIHSEVEAHESGAEVASSKQAFAWIVVALVADGFEFHIPRGYIYFAMAFAGAVEAFNVMAKRNRRRPPRT